MWSPCSKVSVQCWRPSSSLGQCSVIHTANCVAVSSCVAESVINICEREEGEGRGGGEGEGEVTKGDKENGRQSDRERGGDIYRCRNKR